MIDHQSHARRPLDHHPSQLNMIRILARDFREQSHERRLNEASQELLFACMSFILLLAAAFADFVFHM